MRSAMVRTILAAAIVCAAAGPTLAQPTTSTATAVKAFEVLAVEGNTIDVNLPEGTREITVTDDFRFTVNGQQLSLAAAALRDPPSEVARKSSRNPHRTWPACGAHRRAVPQMRGASR